MTTVRLIKVRSRLSRMAFKGGITVHEALKRANAAIDELRPPCLAVIDETLAEIAARFGPDAAGRAAEPLDDLYILASSLIDVSIGLPDSGLDRGARALCELVDRNLAAGTCGWAAIDVHIRALQLLRVHGQGLSEHRRHAIISGLNEVSIKQFGAPEPV